MKLTFLFFLTLAIVSCGGPSINPFTSALDNLADKTRQIIDHAQSAGQVLEVTAGAQILNTIVQAKQAYEDGLIKTSNAADHQQQDILTGLNSSIENIDKHQLQGLTAKIQSIANTLPISNKFPQIINYEGTVTDCSGNYTTITLGGNYVDIPTEGFQSYIEVGSSKIENSIRTTSQISFIIPNKLLKKKVAELNYVPVSIDIPYKKGFFNTKAVATFQLILVVLPGSSPGELTVTQNKSVDLRKDTTITTTAKTWDSGDGDVDLTQGFDVIPGWTIDHNTVSHAIVGQQGSYNRDWYDYGNASTPTWVGWHIKATHKNSPWGHNGAVSLTFTYKAYKDIPTLTDFKTDILHLKWGESKVVTIDPLATWKIKYTQFNNKTFEIASNIRNNSYLKFDQSGNQLQISAVPFEDDLP